jgi:predicted SAM-dependent methyltransferase
MKLHLGCGKRYIPGWTHIDVIDYPHVDIIASVDRLPFIATGTVDIVYSCHVLEHFHRKVAIDVLYEWTRVLKPGGVLRIAVPDFAALASIYLLLGAKLSDVIGPLFGRQDYLYNYHHAVYDAETLRGLLEQVGLTDVKHYDWRETEHADVDDFAQAYWPHMDREHGTLVSLNMEGTKP